MTRRSPGREARALAALALALAALALALAALLAPAAAPAAWQQPVGGEQPVNRDASHRGSQPSIAEYDGTPYLAWTEEGQIQAARLSEDGTAWVRPEDSASPINVSPSADAEDPTLRRGGPGEDPCVAFDEAAGAGTRIHMSCLTTATEWKIVGDSPNRDLEALATEPSLTLFDGITWVAWSEVDEGGVNQIRVAKLPDPGIHWQRVPDTASPINAVATDKAFHPSLVAVGARLYVAWNEVDSGGVSQIRVARLNAAGDGWEAVGGVLNKEAGDDAFEASMAAVGGVPYVAWSETNGRAVDQLRVARLGAGGEEWELVADSDSPINHDFDTDAEHPSLTAIGGVPYVSWSEKDASGVEQVRVARLDAAGSAWEEVVDSESPINDDAKLAALEPSLTAIGGFPYVGWSEEDEEGIAQVRASRLVPDFLGAEAIDPTPSGATLRAKLRTYGLPYPVGFEYGAALGELETAPVAAPSGQEEPVVSQPVGGLSADSHYEARPFATAGVALPRVSGSAFLFATPAAQRTLTVARAGTGSGTVRSSPAGIECGSSCAASFAAGTTVTLSATAAPGSTFAGWSGGGCAGTGPCTVVLAADATVTASFDVGSMPLTPPGGRPAPPAGPSPAPPAPAPPVPPLLGSAPEPAPRAKILAARISSAKGRARFRFRAVGAPARRFRCALRKGSKRARFRRCRSPKTYRHLKPGRYTFAVQAVSAAGSVRPAVRHFRIARQRR